MTETTDSPLFPCPQCAAPTVFRYGMGHYYPRKCDTCALEARRARDRLVAERRRRAKGIVPVKGTVITCSACREPFVRNSVKAVRCKPCQREDYLARARLASAASNEARGYRRIGDPASCARCAAPFVLTAGKQKQCEDCRALPDRDRWEAVVVNSRKNNKAYRERHPDREKKRQRDSYQRRKQDPAYTISDRMSAGVRYSLTAGKQGSRWEKLVGYSLADLMRHLERQFLPGMTWENRGEWHIDHITALSTFRFETAEDPEFRAAWALTNLRPLWALDNITKNDRRTHLL